MKILLSSDWHLGKFLYREKLLSKQAEFFQGEFLSCLKDLKPDLLIVAGDILDRPIPDQETLYFYEDFLKELSTYKIPSFFILGNHDSRRTAYHSYFLEQAQIYLIDHLKYFFTPFSLKDNRGEEVNFYFLPYLPLYELLEKARAFLSFEIPESITYTTLLETLFKEIPFKRPAFIVTHFALDQFQSCGEEISIKGFSEDYVLPESMFQSFDIACLGHLHRPQMKKEKFIYPGAPMPYSFETFIEERGVRFIEWRDNRIIRNEFMALTSPYELLTLKGTFAQIEKQPKTNAYTKIILEDEKPIFNVYERLKALFPNLLYLEYTYSSNFSKEDKVEVNFSLEAIDLDEKALFREFYALVEGKEIEPKLWEVFLKNLEEFYNLEKKEVSLCQ